VLPCDALAAVLGHVADVDLKKMASRVCRAWRSASALPRAWSSMTIDNGRGARIVGEVEAIGLIRRHGSEMRVLSIADERMQLLDAQNTGPSKEGSIISSALVAAIATHCPELHSLELRARKDADLAAATEVVALVEGIAASRPGGKIRLLGCNLLRGQSLARCGKLVETMTSGECCGGRCSSSQRTSYADFFEDPVLWRMNEVSHVLERRGVFLCTVAGCTGGAMCTSCACGSQDSVRILHCKTCKRTCCQDCLDYGQSPGFESGPKCPGCPPGAGFLLCSDCHPKVTCSQGTCGAMCCEHCASKLMRSCAICSEVWCTACAESEGFACCNVCDEAFCGACWQVMVSGASRNCRGGAEHILVIPESTEFEN